ncbi:MAG: AAA family ATPase [Patescibacteria group bacterium]
MRISKIHIENFRSAKNLDIEFPESGMLVLVGPNNAGKSNILRAVHNILGEFWFKGETAELNDFYNKDKSNVIKIEITFDNNRRVVFDSSKSWPTYFNENGTQVYASSGNVKDDFPCTYLPANRSVEKNLQFKKWELMGKIAKSFNDKAQAKKEELEQKFDEVMRVLDEVENFKNFKEDFVSFFDEMQADSPYRLKVNFKAFTPINYFKSINILANDSSINDKYDIDVEELGDGNKSLMLFALIRSYAKNFKKEAQGLLAIEEPEIYLHPQARRHLYSVFKEIVKNSNIQILISTHSSAFLDTEEFYQIGVVGKNKDEGTKVRQVNKQTLISFCESTGVPKNQADAENISTYYGSTSNYRLNEGFFSKFLILVEGETEERALPLYLEAQSVFCDFSGISIIGVGGKGQIPKYWRLFKSFGLPTLILFDNDNSDDKRSSNGIIANTFNIRSEEITDGTLSIYKELDCEKSGVFKQKLIVLEQNFETALKKDFDKYCSDNSLENKYETYLNEAREIIKPEKDRQKGAMARFVAKRIRANYPNYIPSFVSKISEIIK